MISPCPYCAEPQKIGLRDGDPAQPEWRCTGCDARWKLPRGIAPQYHHGESSTGTSCRFPV